MFTGFSQPCCEKKKNSHAFYFIWKSMLTLVIYLKGGRKCDSKKSLESNHFLAIYNRKYQDSSWCKHNWLFNNFLAGPYNPYLNSLGGEDRIKEYLLAMHFLTKEFTILYFSGFHFENGHEGRQICSDINIKPLCPLTGRKQVSSSSVLTEIYQTTIQSKTKMMRPRVFKAVCISHVDPTW